MLHPLRSLLIIIFFSLAATGCGSEQAEETTETTDSGCSTEADLKAIITKDKMAGKLPGDIERTITFHSFTVDGPMEYTNTSGTAYAVVTDKAYRVKTSYDVTRKVLIGVERSQTQRDRYVDVIYTCYTVNWSDGPNCVCYAEKNAYPAVLGEVIE